MLRNESNTNQNNEEAYEYACDILAGVGDGLMNIVHQVMHPLDEIVYPISELVYDSIIISAGAIHLTRPGGTVDMAILLHTLATRPQLYHDAVNRMRQRINTVAGAGQTFWNSSRHEQVRALSALTTSILVPGWFLKAAKLGAGVAAARISMQREIHQALRNPPVFPNGIRDLPREIPPIKKLTLRDVRNIRQEEKYLWVLTKDKELLMTPRRYQNLSNGKIDFIFHSELAEFQEVLGAGEVTFNRFGKIIEKGINNSSGHYMTNGLHIKKMVTTAFVNAGYIEARGKYVDVLRPATGEIRIIDGKVVVIKNKSNLDPIPSRRDLAIGAAAVLNPSTVDKTKYNRAALHVAVLAGDVARVKWLVENGAKVVKDDYGKFPHQLTNEALRNDADYQKRRSQCEQLLLNKKLIPSTKVEKKLQKIGTKPKEITPPKTEKCQKSLRQIKIDQRKKRAAEKKKRVEAYKKKLEAYYKTPKGKQELAKKAAKAEKKRARKAESVASLRQWADDVSNLHRKDREKSNQYFNHAMSDVTSKANQALTASIQDGQEKMKAMDAATKRNCESLKHMYDPAIKQYKSEMARAASMGGGTPSYTGLFSRKETQNREGLRIEIGGSNHGKCSFNGKPCDNELSTFATGTTNRIKW